MYSLDRLTSLIDDWKCGEDLLASQSSIKSLYAVDQADGQFFERALLHQSTSTNYGIFLFLQLFEPSIIYVLTLLFEFTYAVSLYFI